MIKFPRNRFAPLFSGTMIVILTLMVGMPAFHVSVDLAEAAGHRLAFFAFAVLCLMMIATMRNFMRALHARVPGKIALTSQMKN